MAAVAHSSGASQYTRRQRTVVLVSAMIGFGLDAFDLLMLSFVIVPLSKDFGVPLVGLGAIFSLQLFFSMVGGVLFGRLADLYGRKRMLVASIALYSIGGLLSAVSWDATSLGVFRAIAGLGLGGEWGVGTALFNEVYSSSRWRAVGSGMIQSSYNLGVLLASVVAQWCLGTFGEVIGWRMAMLSTAFPIFAAVVIRQIVPESKVWEEYDALRRAGRLPPEKQRSSALGWDLFKPPTLQFTLTTLLVVSGFMFAFYAVSPIWPTLMTQVFNAGGAVAAVTVGATLISACSQLVAGYLGDRWGRKASFIVFQTTFLIGFGLIWLFTSVQSTPYDGNIWTWPPYWAYVVWWSGSSCAALYGVWFSEIFPTDLRGVGVSMAYMVGRGTSAISPVLVPALAPAFGLAGAMQVGVIGALMTLLLALTLPETLGRQLHAVEKVSKEGVVELPAGTAAVPAAPGRMG
jgi:MFS family permease